MVLHLYFHSPKNGDPENIEAGTTLCASILSHVHLVGINKEEYNKPVFWCKMSFQAAFRWHQADHKLDSRTDGIIICPCAVDKCSQPMFNSNTICTSLMNTSGAFCAKFQSRTQYFIPSLSIQGFGEKSLSNPRCTTLD